ncbi:ABC transporter ATP-binding protein [Corynebacterium pseudotuberculosis]|uniref:ATP-binding cassette domain-containing protein n=1 Tax=Corynebacterium pseudotuberculosis 258 TaxID=1168865 RepID=A0AAU8PPL5_CORPS|nr:ABC transporter ATP-binding protein [Corynebacterium pseudotuberculosis]AER70039.1 ABC-type antimicrobial peptide transport system, ATPase component [Corynebacterium pseudotuberculosis 1/06-A]AEQ07572.1 ATP-binding cassette domain-containing protein [Corynebacterium pseudotuberculosis CIP 52.97]AFB73387.1 ATP-binding cassette domain-containing protein [Corynebacterium pseudotuberculosis 316]AFH91846.1 ATP-binding cassette domain-containing protein [Corynebacterium pseudotuberculosis 31]AFK1
MIPVLSLEKASVVYPDGSSTVTALDAVDLEVRSGELLALVGESGSGKSTLLSVAGALQTPTSGTVMVAGQDIQTLDDAGRAKLRREKIGFVFQQANLLGSLNAREQLLVTDHVRGIRGSKLRARYDRADELLARVGLEGKENRKIAQLSGGQRQRVNIARALMGNPALLLADEPTSALDRRMSVEIVSLLSEITKEFDVATVMVTHDLSQLSYADTVVELIDGARKD